MKVCKFQPQDRPEWLNGQPSNEAPPAVTSFSIDSHFSPNIKYLNNLWSFLRWIQQIWIVLEILLKIAVASTVTGDYPLLKLVHLHAEHPSYQIPHFSSCIISYSFLTLVQIKKTLQFTKTYKTDLIVPLHQNVEHSKQLHLSFLDKIAHFFCNCQICKKEILNAFQTWKLHFWILMHFKHSWHSLFAEARESLKVTQLRYEIVNKSRRFHIDALSDIRILQNKKIMKFCTNFSRFHSRASYLNVRRSGRGFTEHKYP